jgi:hypothetical protein
VAPCRKLAVVCIPGPYIDFTALLLSAIRELSRILSAQAAHPGHGGVGSWKTGRESEGEEMLRGRPSFGTLRDEPRLANRSPSSDSADRS